MTHPAPGVPANAHSTDIERPQVALAIGAHPDDVEFGCGATLAKWAAGGTEIHVAVLTDGSKGSWDPITDTDTLAALRVTEQHAAAAKLSETAAVHMLGYTDGELVHERDVVGRVARLIREVRPNAILGHDPWKRYRLHPDHRNAGFIVLDAVVAARDPLFFTEHGLDHHRPDHLLVFEADEPNHVERVDGFAQAKIDALLAHESQYETTMYIETEDAAAQAGRARFSERITGELAEAAARAPTAGTAHGEAFHLFAEV